MTTFIASLHTALLAGFMALLLVVPGSYYVVPLVAALLAPWALARPAVAPAPDREDALCLAALLAFGGVWCLDVWRTGVWPVGEGNQGLFLPLWPLLAAWVVFPLLLAVLAWAFGEGLPRRRLWPLAGVLAALLIGGALLPQSGVRDRVDEAVDNLRDYAQGDAASSLGARLDMWRAVLVVRPALAGAPGPSRAGVGGGGPRGDHCVRRLRVEPVHVA
ncbi:O-Antigen ligase [Alcanivorax sp. 521-1]|uniref:O-Antigen ligase n=1 Tax=Alloalcanivorax profundimaris TaxID=2735259 RepID=A0ABS0APJ4_9GAMM|nr:hypothetical protein [Alloalcanivorax profundimaris]MBF5056051.1 O-Antigen ligase [Alloalcanivorax profundimaris]